MIRIRMIATAFLILAAMPGCGIFHKDRPCFPRLNALFCGKSSDNTVSYPVMSSGGPGAAPCETCGNPGVGGPVITGPMIGQPGVIQGPITTTPPGAKIPPAGIKESEGKQFELEGASKIGPGPVLAVPAGGSKNR